MKQNDHLIPVVVKDLVDKIERDNLTPNEKLILLQRLETIRDFCDYKYKTLNYVDFGQVFSEKK